VWSNRAGRHHVQHTVGQSKIHPVQQIERFQAHLQMHALQLSAKPKWKPPGSTGWDHFLGSVTPLLPEGIAVLCNAQFCGTALARLHDDLYIVPQGDQEAHQALDGVPPELACQHR